MKIIEQILDSERVYYSYVFEYVGKDNFMYKYIIYDMKVLSYFILNGITAEDFEGDPDIVFDSSNKYDYIISDKNRYTNGITELYFEEKDIEGFIKKLEEYPEKIQYVNPFMEHSWGQKVVRFYDLDGNLIEVGTPV